MAAPIRAGNAAPPRPRLGRLLATTALCGASLFFALAAQAQTLPGIPNASAITVATGGAQPVITAPTANALNVNLNANRTVINWDSFHVSSADSVTFNFLSASGIVLNKSPSQVKVDAGGTVTGLVGAATGGNIWFYSPNGVVISPGAIMTAGNFVFARGDNIVDADFVDAAAPLDVLRAASDSLIQINTLTAATGASISATGDVVLTAGTGDLNATTVLAGGSATVSATTGSVTIGEVTATSGAANVTAPAGAITLGQLNGNAGATANGLLDVSVTSATAGSASGDIALTGGASASLGNGVAGRNLTVSGPTASLTSGTAAGSVFVTATTGEANVTGVVNAGNDIEITATTGSVTAGTATLTATGSGAPDDAHVLAQSTSGSVTVGSATTQGTGSAAGDVTIDGATTASLTSGSATHDLKVLGPDVSLGSGSAANSVFVTGTTGGASVTGAVTAGNDIEVTATTGSVAAATASLTATGAGAPDDAHVLAQSTGGSVSVGSAATQGSGARAGDITISAATDAELGSGSSTRDLKVQGPTAGLGFGTASRDLFVTATSGSATVTSQAVAGDDIEVTAGGSIVAGGADLKSNGTGAVGDAHVLAQSSGGSVSIGSAETQATGAAAGDITIGGATTASLGSGSSSHNLTVQGASASLGSGGAAGSVLVTATTGAANVTGAVTAGDDIEVTATTGSVNAMAASLTSTGAGAVGDAHVLARSTGSSAVVGSATTQGTGAAAGDITVSGSSAASLGSGQSSRDIKVQAASAGLGPSAAARDVFITGSTGGATASGAISAGDDIEVTATTGAVDASAASLISTGAGAVGDAHVLARSTGGSAAVGAATTQGTGAAAGDITVNGATTASLDTGHSTHNLTVEGPSASLTSGSAANDLFVTSTTGSASVAGSASAGDSIEVTATTGSVTAGSLTSTGVGASGDAHVLVRSTGGAVSVGSATTQAAGAGAGNITIDGSTTATLTGAATATGDVSLLAGSTVTAGGSTITAGRDAAIRSTNGDVNLGSVSAGDDIAVRALSGAVNASGDLLAGQTHDVTDPDPAGAADTLTGATMAGHDLDIKAQTVAVTGNVSAGRAPDMGETLGPAQVASDVIVEATNPDPSSMVAALSLATSPGKSVTAHGDVSLKAENAAASSIQTGDVFAGGDVAANSAAGNISLNSALAGDDVVLRAPGGAISVTGNVESGRDVPGMTAVDAPGAGDTLNAARPFSDFDGNPATIFSVVGFDVNIAGQAVHIGGATIAGRQPSTDSPTTAGAVDTTTSDVRIETRLSVTPVIGLAPDITLGSVIATRDMQIDSAGAITAGGLQAGRDVAVLGRGGVVPGAAPGDHSGAGVTVASAQAGDDALIFSIFGHAHILGSVTSGVPFARLVPTNDRTIDGATEAADQLAIYLHYFDLDDASAPYVLPGSVIHIAGQGITVGGALSAHGVGSDVRLLSGAEISVAGPVTAGGMATFQTQAGGGSVSVGTVSAAGDIFLDGGGAGTGVQAGSLTSTNGDVAVRARDGSAISLADVTAGDDVVVRSTGAVNITGPISAGGGTDSVGQGDALVASSGALTLSGHAYDLSGGNVDIVAGSLTTPGAITAPNDIRIQTTGVVSLSDLTASRDVLVDAGSTVTAGVLNAGRDIAVRSTGAGKTVTIGDASAGDDLVLRAKGAISATGTLTAGTGTDSAATDQAGDLMAAGAGALTLAGHAYTLGGQNVDVIGGSLTTPGPITAPGDVRIQTTGLANLSDLTAGRDVLVDAGSTVTTGVLSAGRDIGVRSTGSGTSVTIGDASAGDDIVIRAKGSIFATGTLTAGLGSDSAATDQAGDLMFGANPTNVAGNLNLTGQTVDLRSTAGSIVVSGAVNAPTDARFQTAAGTGGSITVAAVTAGRDILLDGGGAGPTGVLASGTLTATGGDIAIRARDGSAISLADVTAGDDVVMRATGATPGAINISGAVNAGGGTDSAGLGDAMATAAGALTLEGHAYDLSGSNIDIVGGSVSAVGTLTAAGDVRIQSIGAINLSDLTATRDVLVDGGATVLTGALSAGRDIGVRSTGAATSVTIGNASAGDDLVIRANGSIYATGTLNAGGSADSTASDQAGDLMFGAAKSNLNGDLNLTGQTVDLRSTAGSIVVSGATTAATDARFQTGATTPTTTGGGSVTVAAVTAGHEILLDGGGAGPNGAVATDTLTATSGDVAVRARDGSAVSLAGVSAGDDVVVRTTGAITIAGPISAGGGTDSAGLGDALVTTNGAVSLEGQTFDLTGHDVDLVGGAVTTTGATSAAGTQSDVRVQSIGAISLGALTAGRDVLVDGGDVVSTGTLSAGRDVGVRSTGSGTSVTVGGASAGDDVVIRADGSIISTGALNAGGGTNSTATDQAGDLMFGTAKSNLAGDFDLIGQTVDLRSTSGSVDVMGATTATTDARFQTQATTGGAVVVGSVTAGRDVLLDGSGTHATGALSAASGDVAIRARDGGTINLGNVSAGDDVVLRTSGMIQGSGTITTAGRPTSFGVGDRLIDPSEGGALSVGGLTFGLGSADIDVIGNVVGILRANAAGGVRILAGGVSLSGGGSAGSDILIDSTDSLSVGDLTAAGDIALRSKGGSLSVGNLSAGDDIVLRAAGAIDAGVLKTGDGGGRGGVADMLFQSDPTGLNGTFDLPGGTIDVKSAGGAITIGGADAGGDLRLQTAGAGVSIEGAASAGRDIFADGASVASSGSLTAGRDVALYGRSGSVSVTSVTAGNDVVARAAGDVTASGDLKSGAAPTTGGVGDTLIAATGAVTLFGETANTGVGVIDLRGVNIQVAGNITGGADLRLQSTGATTLAGASVSGDISIDSAGALTGGDLKAGGDIALRSSTGGISIASATAGDDVVLRSVNAIMVSGAINAGQGGDVTGAGDALFALSPSRFGGITFDLAGGNVDLGSTTGAISVLGQITAATDVRLIAPGSLTSGGTVTAGRDVLFNGASIAALDVHAGRDLAANAQGGSVSLGSISAGDDIVLRATGDVTVSGTATAGGAADADGVGDRLFAMDPTALAGNLDLTGANIDVRARGAITVQGAASAAGDARFQTVGGGAVSLAGVTAGQDILADGSAVKASGTLSAGRDVAVRGRTGAVQLAALSAGDNIAIRAAGDVSVSGAVTSGTGAAGSGMADRLISSSEGGAIQRLVDPLATTPQITGFGLSAGDIDIMSGGAITLGGDVNAGGAASLHLQAAGKISAAGITAGDSIFARSSDLSLTGAWNAKTVRVEITAAGGLALGDDVSAPTGGAAISQGEIDLINAPTLQIFLGDSSGSLRGATLSIGNLNIDTSRIKTSLELYAGSAATVNITGAFAPASTGANSTLLRIGAPNADIGDWTPGSIRVIADNGGSIGASTSTGGRVFSNVRGFGDVELNAVNDIFVGYQDFIDKLLATPASGVAQAVRGINAPQVNGGPRILITAGTLTIRANGKVAQQDTEGLTGSTPTGLYLFGGSLTKPQLVLGRSSAKTLGDLPEFIELNGALTTGVTVLTGSSASLTNMIAFEKDVTPSSFYRLNSCAILQPGSCTSSNVHASVTISPDSLTNLTVQDRTAAAGTADPTVASATNEESWKDPR